MEEISHGAQVERYIEVGTVPALCADILAEVRSRNFSGAATIALSGPVGAGKTTFSQAVARSLGVADTIQSPTFVIEKRYATTDSHFSRLVHIDAYRVEDPHELEVLGFLETKTDTHTLILIEWAEHVAVLLPPETLWVWIDHVDEVRRRVRYGGHKEGYKTHDSN